MILMSKSSKGLRAAFREWITSPDSLPSLSRATDRSQARFAGRHQPNPQLTECSKDP
jgi:hypothetical protein